MNIRSIHYVSIVMFNKRMTDVLEVRLGLMDLFILLTEESSVFLHVYVLLNAGWRSQKIDFFEDK